MINKIKGAKANLYNVELVFEEPKKDEVIDVKITDKISIIEIKDDGIDFYASRILNFQNLKNAHLEVSIKVNIATNEMIKREEFEEFVRKNNNNIISGIVFSKISLIISNLTSQSILGVIITPPFYNLKEIEIC